MTAGLNFCYGNDMARNPRIQYTGAFNHMIARGNGGQRHRGIGEENSRK
ncbi:hypothetical protein D1BOALGB6SA_2831 [Olavius sp. associated proteobacterium Delta 1]|nr:hypothetical protein D1BOALGB6SA_2831 [Olavius sp. associated proteobacterium Delta 1]